MPATSAINDEVEERVPSIPFVSVDKNVWHQLFYATRPAYVPITGELLNVSQGASVNIVGPNPDQRTPGKVVAVVDNKIHLVVDAQD